MKRFAIFLTLTLLLILLGACAPLVDPNIVMGTPQAGVPTRTPRPGAPVWSNPPPAQSPLQDRYADLHAQETAIALNREQLDYEQAQLQLQLVRDAATSTAGAQMTSTAVQSAIQTNDAGTQIAQIQIDMAAQTAGTQTAFPLTQTSLLATQEVERVQLQVAKVKAVVWPFLGALAFVAFVALGWLAVQKLITAYHLQKSQILPDERGRYPVVPEDVIPGKTKRMVNMNLAHRAVHDPRIPDDLTTVQALANAHDQRKLETIRSIAESPAMPRIAAAMLKGEQTNTPAPALLPLEGDQQIPMLRLPDAHLLNRWDGTLLPYGSDEKGKLLTFDPAKRPHLMVSGTTGTGKTRYEIRTVVAGALASGWQVIVIGKQADYIPFQEHPNARLIAANAIKESEKYIQLLRAASEEMFRRDELLVSRNLSTWDRYGAPQTMIVIDDYSAAMSMMGGQNAKEVLKWALALAMDGRKYGLNLLLGLQRATFTCISTDLRSQMARITLRVATAHESRIVLEEGGAEALPDRHFLARLEEGSTLIRGAAFAMTDGETRDFLVSRPAAQVGEAGWVDAVATDVPPAAESTVPAEADDDQKIRDVLIRMIREDNVSLRGVEREVWGQARGGQYYEKVQGIYKELRAKGATTMPNVPDSGAIAL